jgi:hypothetical protein
LEELSRKRVRGLFATHLHRIIDDIAEGVVHVPHTVQMSMGTRVVREDQFGHKVRVPTWQLEEGHRCAVCSITLELPLPYKQTIWRGVERQACAHRHVGRLMAHGCCHDRF